MLDDPERVAELDTEDMHGAIAGFADHIEEALAVPLPSLSGIDTDHIERVVFLGMGGSAIGGAYAAAYLDAHGGPPGRVVREYEVPSWVDQRTLVVATSYSGNTEETLSALAQCVERGAPWVAAASGGDLVAAAKEHGAPLVTVPKGFQPRAAFAWLSVPVLRLLAGLGLMDRAAVEASLSSVVPTVRRITEESRMDVPERDNPAKRLAVALRDRALLIVSDGPYECVAERVRAQVNENSKTKAFVRVLPEANHNDTVAWMAHRDDEPWASLWLGRFDHPSVQVRKTFTRDLLVERGVPAHAWPREHEDDVLADMFALTHHGDWLSLYLAYQNGQDPSDVSVIPELKRRCADTGVLGKAKRSLGIG